MGNWGTAEDEVKQAGVEPEGEVKEAKEEKHEMKDIEEKYDDAEERVKVEEEEEEKSMTLQEYMAQKKKATFKKEARLPEEVK